MYFKIKPANKKIYGYALNNYYASIVHDIIDINKRTDWTDFKMLHPNPNQSALNRHILVESRLQDVRWEMHVLMNLIKCIYGNRSRDFRILLRIYNGIKKQVFMMNEWKHMLKYVQMPDHYIAAIAYEDKSIENRINTIRKTMETFIRISPLEAYRNSLPEGRSLSDDIWEFFDLDNIEEYLDEKDGQMEAYLNHIISCTNFRDMNEAREKYQEFIDLQYKKDEKEREEIILQKKKKDLEYADEAASIYADKIYKEHFLAGGRTKESVYKKVLASGCENPRILLMIRAKNASSRGKFVPKYFDKNMELTTAITKSVIFGKEIPEKLKEMHESYEYGYAEILLD